MHPLVPLAKAARILRTDPILLQERLVSGQIKGEKRSDSDPSAKKNSWFIYASEFDRLLNDRLASLEYRAATARVSTEGLDNLFEHGITADTSSAGTTTGTTDSTITGTTDNLSESAQISENDISFNTGNSENDAYGDLAENTEREWQTDGVVLDTTDPQSEVTHIEVSETGFEVSEPGFGVNNFGDYANNLQVAELMSHLQQEMSRTDELNKRIDTLSEEITRLRADLEQNKQEKTISSQPQGLFARFRQHLKKVFI